MYTDIQFVNRSLNPNLPSVGMYFGKGDIATGSQILLWHLVTRCGFLWCHPVRVHWDYLCEFRGRNDKSLFRGSLQNLLACRELADDFGINIQSTITQGQETLRIFKTTKSIVERMSLLRNGVPAAAVSFPWPGNALSVPVTSRISLCADMYLKECDVINDKNLNRSQHSFNLQGIRSLSIHMKGGQPGPHSEPIYFVATHLTHW